MRKGLYNKSLKDLSVIIGNEGRITFKFMLK